MDRNDESQEEEDSTQQESPDLVQIFALDGKLYPGNVALWEIWEGRSKYDLDLEREFTTNLYRTPSGRYVRSLEWGPEPTSRPEAPTGPPHYDFFEEVSQFTALYWFCEEWRLMLEAVRGETIEIPPEILELFDDSYYVPDNLRFDTPQQDHTINTSENENPIVHNLEGISGSLRELNRALGVCETYSNYLKKLKASGEAAVFRKGWDRWTVVLKDRERHEEAKARLAKFRGM